MRNGLGKALRIGLSRSGITLLQTSGWPRSRTDLLCDLALTREETSSPEGLANRLSSLLMENKSSRLPVTVILADEMVRLFMVTPPKNAMHRLDCQAAAEMRFGALYGESIASWQLESDLNVFEPFLTCAIPKLLIGAIQHVAIEHHMTLVEIVPQFIAAWNGWLTELNGGTWFGVAHERIFTIGAIEQQRLCMVRTLSVPSHISDVIQWLPECLAREALRFSFPPPSHIKLYGYLDEPQTTTTARSLNCLRLDAALYESGRIAPSPGVALARTGLRK
jgi:hypothetical protein